MTTKRRKKSQRKSWIKHDLELADKALERAAPSVQAGSVEQELRWASSNLINAGLRLEKKLLDLEKHIVKLEERLAVVEGREAQRLRSQTPREG